MEMVMTNNFTEMSACEMQCIDGGVVPAIFVLIGKAALYGAVSGAASWGVNRLLDWAF